MGCRTSRRTLLRSLLTGLGGWEELWGQLLCSMAASTTNRSFSPTRPLHQHAYWLPQVRLMLGGGLLVLASSFVLLWQRWRRLLHRPYSASGAYSVIPGYRAPWNEGVCTSKARCWGIIFDKYYWSLPVFRISSNEGPELQFITSAPNAWCLARSTKHLQKHDFTLKNVQSILSRSSSRSKVIKVFEKHTGIPVTVQGVVP